MKKILIFSLSAVFLASFFLGCGEEPTGPWVWSVDDSITIHQLLEDEGNFLSSGEIVPSSEVSVELSTEAIESLIDDTTTTRFVVSQINFEVTDSVFGYEYTLGQDTTVTVDVVDTLNGKVTLQVDSLLREGSTEFTVTDTTLEKTLRYASWNGVFVDSSDTMWQLSKFSGGLQGTAPNVAFAPQLVSISLSYPGDSKKVYPSASPDGYAIDGLFETEDFISVTAGSQVSVDEIAVESADQLSFFISSGSDWMPYYPGISVTFSAAGKSRIYVIGLSLESVVYSSTEWACVVWGIPVLVQ